jgi:hypothetical protein
MRVWASNDNKRLRLGCDATQNAERLRWSRSWHAGLWYPSSRVRRIFRGEKILSMPSFGGEVKPSVPCRRFVACKRPFIWCGTCQMTTKFTSHFSPTVLPFPARGLLRRCRRRGCSTSGGISYRDPMEEDGSYYCSNLLSKVSVLQSGDTASRS